MELYFRKIGQGKPLIILHGLYGSGDNWHSIAKSLSSTYEVYLLDQRNHGHSPHSNVHNYKALAADLLEFIENKSITKATILGHSMGGKTAMLFATMYPEKVENLIIVDIAPKAYKTLQSQHPHVLQHLNIMNAFLAINVSEMNSRAEIDEAFSEYVHESGLRHFLLKNVVRDENNKFKWNLNIKALHNSLPQILEAIDLKKIATQPSQLTFPTLFIRGEKSDYIDDTDMIQIKEIFPTAEFVTIFDAGHWVHAEQPELFVKSATYFLEK